MGHLVGASFQMALPCKSHICTHLHRPGDLQQLASHLQRRRPARAAPPHARRQGRGQRLSTRGRPQQRPVVAGAKARDVCAGEGGGSSSKGGRTRVSNSVHAHVPAPLFPSRRTQAGHWAGRFPNSPPSPWATEGGRPPACHNSPMSSEAAERGAQGPGTCDMSTPARSSMACMWPRGGSMSGGGVGMRCARQPGPARTNLQHQPPARAAPALSPHTHLQRVGVVRAPRGRHPVLRGGPLGQHSAARVAARVAASHAAGGQPRARGRLGMHGRCGGGPGRLPQRWGRGRGQPEGARQGMCRKQVCVV